MENNTNKELSLREIQLAALDVLKKIADVCEQENLKYTLMYGTLLGAIRHQGFIPWDDDIDISMPRPDYEKLLKHLQENPIEHLEVFRPETHSNYPYALTRISDNRYELDVENEDDYGIGVFVDVYVLDGLGNDLEQAKSYCKKMKFYSSSIFQATRQKFTIGLTKGLKKQLLKLPFYLQAKLRGKDYYLKKINKEVETCDYQSSNYVGCIIWGSEGENEAFDKSWIDETEKIKFEHYEFRISSHYDVLLKQSYGDYMALPPENERISHHQYNAYFKS